MRLDTLAPALAAALLLCGAAEAAEIRVGIRLGTPSFRLRTDGEVFVRDVRSGRRYLLVQKSPYEITPVGGLVRVAGETLGPEISLDPKEGDLGVKINGVFYRGRLAVKATPEGLLNVVEHLDIEDYLEGVLPVEMSPGSPLEALKAQAVASRSYAMKRLSPSRDYDVTADVNSQVYNGRNNVNGRIRTAIEKTRGQVLTYKGKIVTAYFHACCGGHTASSTAAWGEDIYKPLYGVKDPFCASSRHSSWQLYIPERDLLSFIQKQGSTSLSLKKVRVAKKDRSGRALRVAFDTEKKTHYAEGKAVRTAFGNSDFRSTLITSVTPTSGGWLFKGRGWGHGVGMCQAGAAAMANNGRDYKRILRHYYPGASITVLK
ncbi:MAG: SpoIID/LytB domain-containing protein [Elusimicrobiota bacterium]